MDPAPSAETTIVTGRTALLRFLAERIVEKHLREEQTRTIDAPAEAEKNTQAKPSRLKNDPQDEAIT